MRIRSEGMVELCQEFTGQGTIAGEGFRGFHGGRERLRPGGRLGGRWGGVKSGGEGLENRQLFLLLLKEVPLQLWCGEKQIDFAPSERETVL